MSIHLINEERKLKSLLQTLSGNVEQAVSNAVRAFIHNDVKLAEEIIENDKIIDEMEIELEEECLKILALYQPVAVDLRYIVSCLKINNDLERIGDLAAKGAKRVKTVAKSDIKLNFDFIEFMNSSREMLKNSLDALLNMNIEQAQKVCEDDQKVDDMKKVAAKEIKNLIKQDPENVSTYLQYLGLTRDIERIADYATNIAEDVIYMIEGRIVRHNNEPLIAND